MRKSIGDEKAKAISYYRPGSFKGSIYAGSTEKEWLAELLGGGMDSISSGSFMYLWRP